MCDPVNLLPVVCQDNLSSTRVIQFSKQVLDLPELLELILGKIVLERNPNDIRSICSVNHLWRASTRKALVSVGVPFHRVSPKSLISSTYRHLQLYGFCDGVPLPIGIYPDPEFSLPAGLNPLFEALLRTYHSSLVDFDYSPLDYFPETQSFILNYSGHQFASLKRLTFRQFGRVTNVCFDRVYDILNALLAKAPNLESLTYMERSVAGESFGHPEHGLVLPASLTSLRIVLWNSPFSIKMFWNNCGSFPAHLTQFSLQFYGNVEPFNQLCSKTAQSILDATYGTLRTCFIQDMYVSKTRVTPSVTVSVPKMNQLEVLTLDNVLVGAVNAPKNQPCRLPSLRSASFKNTWWEVINNFFPQGVTGYPKLKSFTFKTDGLTGCLDSNQMARLSDCLPNCTDLELTLGGVNEAVVTMATVFSRMGQLTSLSIHIQSWSHMQCILAGKQTEDMVRLIFNPEMWKTVDFGANGVTNLPNLRKLVISFKQEGIERREYLELFLRECVMDRMPSLTQIDLNGCGDDVLCLKQQQ